MPATTDATPNDGRKNNRGTHRNLGGRPTKYPGEKKIFTSRIEVEVYDQIMAEFGSIAACLRWAVRKNLPGKE